jgi:hypothetical protein
MDAKSKGRFDMKSTGIRLMGAAVVLSTIAIAAPVPSAVAAATGPVAGQAAAVTRPTFVATAPSTFVNYNSQTSAGAVSSGNQVAA